jgi:hypothetical protein
MVKKDYCQRYEGGHFCMYHTTLELPCLKCIDQAQAQQTDSNFSYWCGESKIAYDSFQNIFHQWYIVGGCCQHGKRSMRKLEVLALVFRNSVLTPNVDEDDSRRMWRNRWSVLVWIVLRPSSNETVTKASIPTQIRNKIRISGWRGKETVRQVHRKAIDFSVRSKSTVENFEGMSIPCLVIFIAIVDLSRFEKLSNRSLLSMLCCVLLLLSRFKQFLCIEQHLKATSQCVFAKSKMRFAWSVVVVLSFSGSCLQVIRESSSGVSIDSQNYGEILTNRWKSRFSVCPRHLTL